MKMVNVPHQPLTIERLERGLITVAHLMVEHGMALTPIFEKLEREIAAMRADQDAMGRAKRLLESYRTAGGMKEPGLIEVDSPYSCASPLIGEMA